MTSGDIKGDEAVVLVLTAGSAITAGDLVHEESDGYYDTCATSDQGKFAVAIEAATGAADTFRAVIWGRVEIDVSTNVTQGLAVADNSGYVKMASYTDYSSNYACGTIMDVSANSTATLWVGLVA